MPVVVRHRISRPSIVVTEPIRVLYIPDEAGSADLEGRSLDDDQFAVEQDSDQSAVSARLERGSFDCVFAGGASAAADEFAML